MNYVTLDRNQRRVPKEIIKTKRRGMSKPKTKATVTNQNYALMDTWGQALDDMRKAGTMPADLA